MRHYKEYSLSRQRDRASNEDRVWAGRLRLRDGKRVRVACVADGVGGAQHGAEVATLCCDLFLEHLKNSTGADFLDGEKVTLWVNEFAMRLQALVAERYEGGYSTFCAVLLIGSKQIVLNVGDSGAYWITKRYARRLTNEHTVGERLLREGEDEEEIASRLMTALDRAVGKKSAKGALFDVEIEPLPQERGWLVVASDGVLGYMGGTELRQSGVAAYSARRVAENIMESALQRGRQSGRKLDNATVAVLRVHQCQTKLFLAVGIMLCLVAVGALFFVSSHLESPVNASEVSVVNGMPEMKSLGVFAVGTNTILNGSDSYPAYATVDDQHAIKCKLEVYRHNEFKVFIEESAYQEGSSIQIQFEIGSDQFETTGLVGGRLECRSVSK